MKLKKILISILSLIMFLSVGFAVACSSNDAELIDFNDETVEVAYQSTYVLSPELVVLDSEGNVYKATATVKDSKEQEVKLFAERFVVEDKDGYIANITVDALETTVTRTLTIKVIDKSMPKISVSDLSVGTVGEEYVIPEISVNKVFDDVEPTIGVQVINVDTNEECAIENNKFTPNKGGIYKLVITAIDQYGGKTVIEKFFQIRSAVAGIFLENFAEEMSSDNVKANDAEWLETYADKNDITANGVVKFTSDVKDDFLAEYARSKVKFVGVRSAAQIKALDFDYINVRMLIDGNGTFDIGKGSTKFATIEGKVWTDVKILKTDLVKVIIKDNQNDATTEEQALDFLANTLSMEGSGDHLFYVYTFGTAQDWEAIKAIRDKNNSLKALTDAQIELFKNYNNYNFAAEPDLDLYTWNIKRPWVKEINDGYATASIDVLRTWANRLQSKAADFMPDVDIDQAEQTDIRNAFSDYINTTAQKHKDLIKSLKSFMKGVQVYLDSVSFIGFTEKSKLPSFASLNEEVVLPELELNGFGGAQTLCDDVSVAFEGGNINVVNNKITLSQKGSYVINYKFNIEGVKLNSVYCVDVDCLQAFGDANSNSNIWSVWLDTNPRKYDSIWHEEYTDISSVTKNGVAEIPLPSSGGVGSALYLKFALTTAQIAQLNDKIESIAITWCYTRNAGDAVYAAWYVSAENETDCMILDTTPTYNTWQTTTITAEQLLGCDRFNNAGKLDLSSFGSDGQGQWLLRHDSKSLNQVYIDGITVTLKSDVPSVPPVAPESDPIALDIYVSAL